MEFYKNSSNSFAEKPVGVGQSIILESDSMMIKTTFAVVGIAFMVFATVAVIALNQTTRTPVTARFLSSGLIVYDVLAVLCFTIRKFITRHELNIMIQVTGTGFVFLAFTTVGIMSFERLIIFYSPNFYMRNATPSRVKKFVSVLWLLMAVMYYFIRYGVCFIVHDDATIYDVIGKCNAVSFGFYGIFLVLITTTSIVCYLKIIHIILAEKKLYCRRRHTLANAAKLMRRYKSTSMVFFYIFTITVTSLAFAFIISLGLSPVALRITNDAVNMMNCILDPLLYVVWYKECRLQMLKMIAKCSPTLQEYTEQMRIAVFHIAYDNNKRPLRECAETGYEFGITNTTVLSSTTPVTYRLFNSFGF